jgi:polysaccharide biosynthesis transport protein
MDLIYLLKVLYRKIWIILAVPLIAGIAAFFFTRDIEKKYKSAAQLSTGFTTNNRVQVEKEHFDYFESKANFENLVEMMKSDLIGSMVSYNLLLHDLEGNTPFRRRGAANLADQDSIIKKLKFNLANFELLTSYNEFENRIIALRDERGYDFSRWIKDKELVIERIRDTDFIKVEFQSENPFLSAYVVNKLCDEYIRYNNTLKSTVTEESLDFFAKQVELKKSELDLKTEELNSFKSESQVFNYEKESGTRLGQLSEYEIKLQEEENRLNGISISLRSVNSRLANYNKGNDSNAKLLELRSKINELNQIYLNGGSKDKDLATTIRGLQDQLQSEMEKHDMQYDQSDKKPKTQKELQMEKEELELEYEIVTSNLASIRRKVSSLQSNVSRIGSKESTIASLERERESAFKEYTMSTEKFNEAKSKSMISGNGVKLMVKGQPNAKPESSKRLIIIVLAMVACGALCLGTIILTEYFDYRLKTPDKFESFSKLKLIGYINQIDTKKVDLNYLFKQKEEREEVEQIKHFLRKIRFVIDNSGKRVLLVSSTKQGEGKTFIIMSLAYSLSLLNKRVLIVDTNFKHNSLTKLMVAKPMIQKAQEQKLLNDKTNTNNGATSDEEYSKGIIYRTYDKNVDIIGSREGLESPSEIFASKDFTGMIDTLKANYDYIFMEGPSLNEYSDTKELIQYVDSVIGVFSAKSTLKPADRESIKYLKTLNGKFLGAILNNVDKEDIKV